MLAAVFFAYPPRYFSHFLPSNQANFEIRLFYPVFSLLASILFLFSLYIYIYNRREIDMDEYIKIEISMDKDRNRKKDR